MGTGLSETCPHSSDRCQASNSGTGLSETCPHSLTLAPLVLEQLELGQHEARHQPHQQ
jgi:hypothetical protein